MEKSIIKIVEKIEEFLEGIEAEYKYEYIWSRSDECEKSEVSYRAGKADAYYSIIKDESYLELKALVELKNSAQQECN